MTVIKKFILLFSVILPFIGNTQVYQSRKVILMGSKFEIGVVAKDSLLAQNFIDTAIQEITRIEYLISDWKIQTQVGQINANAGIKPIKVSDEVLLLTKNAIHFSEITDGAFDISFAAMDKIWKFDGEMDSVPSAEAVKYAVRNVGYQKIKIDTINHTIFLPAKGMKIGFGATGKSYAAEKAKQLLMSKGVQAGIINASGDICTWGNQVDDTPWKIGIEHPINNGKLVGVLYMQNNAVVTSGSYEKFVLLDGKRYSHIINPKTGYPVSGLISVTVVGSNAEIANGLSTAAMVMGYRNAKQLFKQFPDYQYLMISDSGRKYASKKLKLKRK